MNKEDFKNIPEYSNDYPSYEKEIPQEIQEIINKLKEIKKSSRVKRETTPTEIMYPYNERPSQSREIKWSEIFDQNQDDIRKLIQYFNSQYNVVANALGMSYRELLNALIKARILNE